MLLIPQSMHCTHNSIEFCKMGEAGNKPNFSQNYIVFILT